MPLLREDQLQWSPVVANSAMNRARGARGPNSYEKDLKIEAIGFLEATLARQGHAAWLDLCCGEGRALRQTAEHFQRLDRQSPLTLRGVDLLDAFGPAVPDLGCLSFAVASVVEWVPDRSYDLVTCSHGLHYLGDKLRVVEQAVGCLSPGGLFVANLDLANIVVEGDSSARRLRQLLRNAGLQYDARARLLRRSGPAAGHFPLRYLGADDTTGPNYSGQPAVTSYYAPLPQ